MAETYLTRPETVRAMGGDIDAYCRDLIAEVERLRAVLETIAGSAQDKLQALQARAALDNIGPANTQER